MTFTLGDIEITPVVVSRFGLDGGAMFGVVPRAAWSRHVTPDAEHRIPLVARALVVTNRRAGYRCLLEAGLGDHWTDKEAAQFALDRVALSDALRRSGIDPDTITDVALTHLHWDHAGGVTTHTADGQPTEALPRARVHVGESHLVHANSPALKDRGSFRATEVSLANRPTTRRLPDHGEVLPGVTTWRSNGHTDGLLVLEIAENGQRVVFPTDLVPTFWHARPAWGMAYDNFPLTVVDEKVALLERAADDGAIVALYHDAEHEALRVRRDGARLVPEPFTLRDATRAGA